MSRSHCKIALMGALVFLLQAIHAQAYDASENGQNLEDNFQQICQETEGANSGRVVCADIAAIDQTIIYNRFGSFNPFGMMYTLKRDLVPMEAGMPTPMTAEICNEKLGTETYGEDAVLQAGAVRLKDCKRPRPLTLRANTGDVIVVRVTNYLNNYATNPAPQDALPPDFSQDVCGNDRFDKFNISEGTDVLVEHGEASCVIDAEAEGERDVPSDWPATRLVNFVVQGLHPMPLRDGEAVHPACLGTGAVGTDESFYCKYRVDEEGTYFLASTAAPAGGEGDGGSIVHGLFGAVIGERAGATWYRSQLPEQAFDEIWPRDESKANRHARLGLPNYEKTDEAGVPLANMAQALDVAQSEFVDAKHVEIVHSDLNAVIYCDPNAPTRDCGPVTYDDAETQPHTVEPHYRAFREFSVFFHDELKAFYGKNFEELGLFGQLAGVKDGFAINYGASGMGSLLLANRKGIGPAAECMECLYEEFFLTSWANGDPALLEQYADDPSNVHHSYLNDPVVFRNFHAGPKETHVFHLHAHQWFGGNDPGRGTYLDSQTVAPQQGFTYNIYHGGLRQANGTGQEGWWDTHGAGNRNRTLGDSIFHCHLYPHFAQGMWALWRVHDVLEDGSRKLPDGQGFEGLSTEIVTEFVGKKRSGSVDLATGEWIENAEGTPVPAVLPLPDETLPLLPTYSDGETEVVAMPGFPYTLAGEAGHRPPQAPLDIARGLEGAMSDAQIDDRTYSGEWLDGGLGRHVVLDGSTRSPGVRLSDEVEDMLAGPDALEGQDRVDLLSQIVAKSFAFGDLTAHLDSVNIRTLDNAGTPLERASMGFHYNGKIYDPDDAAGQTELKLEDSAGNPVRYDRGGYSSMNAGHSTNDSVAANAPIAGKFMVNGSSPKPGAPFADPCGSASLDPEMVKGNDPLYPLAGASFNPDPFLLGFRRYEASAVQFDMIVNQAGWHDPQARINVLTADSGRFKETADSANRISPLISDSEEPFFFRALSGECIEFRHTNELPKDLELDDFQVKTPTDTIGQHIHLVKFDVTASDGSGNGWNYEDGTFAPDELLARRCASREGIVEGDGEMRQPTDEECAMKDIWRKDLADNRNMFQTTVQRWFADPILTLDERGEYRDRTLKTVFTHDHFGPSSIQQHGFYNALVLEPWADFDADGNPNKTLLSIKKVGDGAELEPLNFETAKTAVSRGADVLTGTQNLVKFVNQADQDIENPDFVHRDFREFALTIADFALLYDPRDQQTRSDFSRDLYYTRGDGAKDSKGMERLYCELLWRRSPAYLRDMCGLDAERSNGAGTWYFMGENLAPAWIAVGTPQDRAHRDRWYGDLVHEIGLNSETNEVYELREHLLDYREKAAGRFGDGVMAQPVAAPMRPEAISVDHHDPYLVNFRNAPIPVRIADKDGGSVRHDDCKPLGMRQIGDTTGEPSEVMLALQNGTFKQCSYQYQLDGADGDMAFALSSAVHGDPETPVLEAFQNERIVFRLIQGAQEVQHTFSLSGQPHKRNIDQSFATGMIPLSTSAERKAERTRMDACFEKAGIGHPSQYYLWLENGADATDAPAYFAQYEEILAKCDNVEGFTFAQEIGISEHFELQGSMRADIGSSFEFAPQEPTETATLQSDYLYHFGSVDALWNGAWGLMRINKGGEGLGFEGTDLESVAPTEIAANLTGGASCPLPKNGESVKAVEAVLIAAETRDVFGTDGTSYSGPLYDPDGLFLAYLKPSDLVPDGFHYEKSAADPTDIISLGEAKNENDDAWQNLDPEKVKTALRAAYDKPQPMVLRVNAGDCVRLRFVNLLSGENGRLADRFGDARLPPIAPLNADPESVVERIPRLDNEIRRAEFDVTDDSLATGVAPSASMALQIGLPGLEAIENVPHPFGLNKTSALEPATADHAPASKLIEFYAGRARLQEDADMTNLDFTDAIANAFFDRLGDVVDIGDYHFERGDEFIFLPEDAENAALQILSEDYSVLIYTANGDEIELTKSSVETDGALSEILGELQISAARAIDGEMHFIPYAFGAVPVTSTADVISHGTHGLFGTIDILPADYPLGAENGYCDSDDCKNLMSDNFGQIEFVEAGYKPSDVGLSACYQTEIDPFSEDSGTKTVREFVLFFQDGLNLWDDDSRLTWYDANSKTSLRSAPDGNSLVKAVPECEICDDSYDRGEQGVNYQSVPYFVALRDADNVTPWAGTIEASDNLNRYHFPANFHANAENAIRLVAYEGEEVVVRVIHPGGRARQQSFVVNGYSYHDLFPGFGFPRGALVAPGKSLSAWLTPNMKEGEYLWFDGPTQLRAGGIWGILDVRPESERTQACAP